MVIHKRFSLIVVKEQKSCLRIMHSDACGLLNPMNRYDDRYLTYLPKDFYFLLLKLLKCSNHLILEIKYNSMRPSKTLLCNI